MTYFSCIGSSQTNITEPSPVKTTTKVCIVAILVLIASALVLVSLGACGHLSLQNSIASSLALFTFSILSAIYTFLRSKQQSDSQLFSLQQCVSDSNIRPVGQNFSVDVFKAIQIFPSGLQRAPSTIDFSNCSGFSQCPLEINTIIFSTLDLPSLLAARQTCRAFRDLSQCFLPKELAIQRGFGNASHAPIEHWHHFLNILDQSPKQQSVALPLKRNAQILNITETTISVKQDYNRGVESQDFIFENWQRGGNWVDAKAFAARNVRGPKQQRIIPRWDFELHDFGYSIWGNHQGEIEIYDHGSTLTEKLFSVEHGLIFSINIFSHSIHGPYLVVTTFCGGILIYIINSKKHLVLRPSPRHQKDWDQKRNAQIVAFTFTSNGLMFCAHKEIINIFNLEKLCLETTIHLKQKHESKYFIGNRYLLYCYKKRIDILDLVKQQYVHSLTQNKGEIINFMPYFSSDGYLFTAVTDKGYLHLWDFRNNSSKI